MKGSDPYQAVFRCVLCGDSKKSATKCRGNIYQDGQKLYFKCFNGCEASRFSTFLHRIDNGLYEDYHVEKFQARVEENHINKIQQLESFPKHTNGIEALKGLKKISQLAWDHPAKQYILSRKVDNIWHSRIYYVPAFCAWTNNQILGKLSIENDEGRILFPFIQDGVMVGFQGRSLRPDAKTKYVTIMLDRTKQKGYGSEFVNPNKTVFVTEGIFDAMLVPNGIAALQGDLSSIKYPDTVYIPDRDVRNKEVMKLARKLVHSGEKVCMLPNDFPGKDLSEAVCDGGLCYEQLSGILHANIYQGLAAQMHFTEWAKIV